jgi:hypothetical protein
MIPFYFEFTGKLKGYLGLKLKPVPLKVFVGTTAEDIRTFYFDPTDSMKRIKFELLLKRNR